MAASLRVLLADDTPAILRFLRFALEEDGRFEIVGEVGDGAEAIRIAAAEHPERQPDGEAEGQGGERRHRLPLLGARDGPAAPGPGADAAVGDVDHLARAETRK